MSTSMLHPPVERALRAVSRGYFLPPAWRSCAAADEPLPIGFGQTTSQPSLVARILDELALTGESRVLEVGTGSGYQTALLAELAGEVFTVERLSVLAVAARERLGARGYRNIRYWTGDGSAGWPNAAPFDAIVVSAAAETVPPALLEQLGPGGRMIVPLGPPQGEQVLVRFDKDDDGRVSEHELGGVRFVPLVVDAL